jgi:hypothetical protein
MRIESPLLLQFLAEPCHKSIEAVLKARFGSVPRDVGKRLRAILDEERLIALTVLAAQCADLKAFREALLA